MRVVCAALLTTTLVVSNAFAASQAVGPLPAGKPAGVKDAAALGPNFVLILLGAGIVVGGIALAASNNSNGGVTTPSTSSTSTTGLP